MVNIGQDIKNELARQERNVSWLARKLGCNRTAVYRIMQKNSIDTALLRSISIILQHNFFKPLEEETEERLLCFSENNVTTSLSHLFRS